MLTGTEQDTLRATLKRNLKFVNDETINDCLSELEEDVNSIVLDALQRQKDAEAVEIASGRYAGAIDEWELALMKRLDYFVKGVERDENDPNGLELVDDDDFLLIIRELQEYYAWTTKEIAMRWPKLVSRLIGYDVKLPERKIPTGKPKSDETESGKTESDESDKGKLDANEKPKKKLVQKTGPTFKYRVRWSAYDI